MEDYCLKLIEKINRNRWKSKKNGSEKHWKNSLKKQNKLRLRKWTYIKVDLFRLLALKKGMAY